MCLVLPCEMAATTREGSATTAPMPRYAFKAFVGLPFPVYLPRADHQPHTHLSWQYRCAKGCFPAWRYLQAMASRLLSRPVSLVLPVLKVSRSQAYCLGVNCVAIDFYIRRYIQVCQSPPLFAAQLACTKWILGHAHCLHCRCLHHVATLASPLATSRGLLAHVVYFTSVMLLLVYIRWLLALTTFNPT